MLELSDGLLYFKKPDKKLFLYIFFWDDLLLLLKQMINLAVQFCVLFLHIFKFLLYSGHVINIPCICSPMLAQFC